MAEKLPTPVDDHTGLPLPIYPFSSFDEEYYKCAPAISAYLQYEYYEHQNETAQEDIEYAGDDSSHPNLELDCDQLLEEEKHHHFFPSNKYTSNKRGALFLRDSRLQKVPVWLHKAYHHLYEGVELPPTVKQRFLMGVYAVAGYMSKVAVDIPATYEKEKDVIRRLKHSEYKTMTQPDMLRGDYIKGGENLRRASKFMTNFILKQEIGSIDELTLEEFLLSEDQITKRELAAYIFTLLADQTTEPIKDNYTKLRKKKRILAKGLTTPADAVIHVTRPYIPENVERLHHAVSQAVAA